MSLYEVAFSGELVAGAQLELVKANLAKIFQVDEQRIALMFSGRRIVIKSGLDEAAAEKYREILARAGAVLEVQAQGQAAEALVAQATPAAAEQKVAEASGKPGKLKVTPRDEYMAAFVDVEAPDLGIAPLGADLADVAQPAETPDVDLSQFSLAPVGSDMGQEKNRPAGPPPDTSHLKLQD